MGNGEDTEKKTEGQLLSEKLFSNKKNSWDNFSDDDVTAIHLFAEEYKRFLDRGKTERECVTVVQEALDRAGFKNLEAGFENSQGGLKNSSALSPGAKVYQVNRGKSLVCAVIGKQPLSAGVNIIGAHVDSPRIDLKANPLYEDAEFALLDTQYYGGIKNYQWTAIPLSIHGVIIRQDGSAVTVRLGEDDGDPVFTITDLLPHLAREQMQKKASEVVAGEDLNVLAGSIPYKDSKAKDKVKLRLLSILNEQYGIVEQDFNSAELELVPAFKARDLGFDRSMIGAYGHDDRCCAYPALQAILEGGSAEVPEKTAISLFMDKEEIGSSGNTGAQSRFFENFIAYLLSGTQEHYSDLSLRLTLSRSSMLSADVNSAFDPNYDGFWDKKNASCCGRGMVLSKYSGGSGKGGGSDANAEFCGKVQALLSRNNVAWQTGDLGKVDKGGGGTIAKYVANLDVDVLDCGIAVLSMHAPFEVISKADLYSTYLGYKAFFKDC
jgi:aspartyl aminopeptidase